MSSIENKVESSDAPFSDFDADAELLRMHKGLENLGLSGFLYKEQEVTPLFAGDEVVLMRIRTTIKGEIEKDYVDMSRQSLFREGGGELISDKFESKSCSILYSGSWFYANSEMQDGDYAELKELFEKYESVAFDTNKGEWLRGMSERYKTTQDLEDEFMSEEEKGASEKRFARLLKMKQGLKALKEKLGDKSSVEEDYAFLKKDEYLESNGSKVFIKSLKIRKNGKEIKAYTFEKKGEKTFSIEYRVEEDGKNIEKIRGKDRTPIVLLVAKLFDTYGGFAFDVNGESGEIEEINRERNKRLSRREGEVVWNPAYKRAEDISKEFLGE